jgi:hypothetical protein
MPDHARRLRVARVGLAACALAPTASGGSYTMESLGVTGDAYDINNVGEIVGYDNAGSSCTDLPHRPFNKRDRGFHRSVFHCVAYASFANDSDCDYAHTRRVWWIGFDWSGGAIPFAFDHDSHQSNGVWDVRSSFGHNHRRFRQHLTSLGRDMVQFSSRSRRCQCFRLGQRWRCRECDDFSNSRRRYRTCIGHCDARSARECEYLFRR